jgi:hypothetical protein
MGRIVVNKHFNESSLITADKFVNKGEIIISNESGKEGVYVLNNEGNTVFIGVSQPQESVSHVFLSSDEYQTLIKNGSVEVNGEIIVYNDNTYYAIYDPTE